MNVLRLSFAATNRPELTMVEYLSSSGEKRSSIRGKTGNSSSDYYSFQWTSAVKALACLGLRASILGVKQASILGDAKSLASALDYALSKPPLWLVEMFGSDRQGEPYAKRLFKRVNPERKRAGPVTINLNPNQFENSSIEIWYGGAKVKDIIEVKALYYSVLESFEIEEQSLGLPIDGSGIDEDLNLSSEEEIFLRNIYEEEIKTSLISSKVFSRSWTSKRVDSLSKDPLFNKINSPHASALNALVDQGPGSVRLGFYDYTSLAKTLNYLPPVKVYTSVCSTGFIALTEYIKNILHVPLDLRYYYPYGVEVVNYSKLLSEESDFVICCTGLGPTAEFFNNPSKGFSPLMFGPTMSHQIVKSKQDVTKTSKGDFLFVNDNPTSAMFCFDALVRSGKLDPKKINIQHCEPEESILSLLENPTARALMWFPHYKFLNYYAGLPVSTESSEALSQTTVVFGNKSLHQNKMALDCIRLLYYHAWLSLLEEPENIKKMAKIILADENFIRFTKRCGGLHYAGGGF